MTIAPRHHLRRVVIVASALILVFFSAPGFAEPRILIVGDSWAQGIWVLRLMDKALEEAGIEGVSSVGEPTALGGSRADQWVRPDYRAKIAETLDAHPSVDMIHLVIGGNDVLSRIKEEHVFEAWDAARRDREWDVVAHNIKRIVEYCLEFPQLRLVVLAGYDYINAETAREAFAVLGQSFHFGGMSQAQVNECFIELETRKRDLALDIEGCVYIHNLGLLQHHFNTPPDAPKPGGPPEYAPFPGGDPTLPMPDDAFMKIEFGGREFAGDGIHPNEEAHLIMLRNAVTHAYAEHLAGTSPGPTVTPP